MKKAFTLAEVLITLAVIGVVAALTIPAMVHKYEQIKFYNAFMKSYNTMQTAFSMINSELGDVTTWGIPYSKNEYEEGEEQPDPDEYIYNLFAKYLNIQQQNFRYAPPSGPAYNYSGRLGPIVHRLSGERWNGYSHSYYFGGDSRKTAILQDGSMVSIGGSAQTAADAGTEEDDIQVNYYFDTNGEKGPNVFGRDIFGFKILNFQSDFFGDCYRKLCPMNKYTEGSPSNCDPSNHNFNDAGFACAGRLLKEGKMNY